MSLCNQCGDLFKNANALEIHMDYCDFPGFKRDSTPSYREYLRKAAKKEPEIYKKYTRRVNPAVPNNSFNPLAVKRADHA